MSSGLIALIDDVAAIAKLAAASLDDVAAQSAKAGAKAAGVVIDDAAVTPRYVVGFAAERELPIIGRIAWGSLRNKIVFLLPGALLLSLLAPWAITPLLMIGGAYLCFEGYEKVHELVAGDGGSSDAVPAAATAEEARAIEEKKIQSAIKTDLILSAEIMAIALATVADRPLWEQAAVLGFVGLAITAAVYGAVALIVKADDLGVSLAAPSRPSGVRAIGRAIVKVMPPFLSFLGLVGTLAMLWVGGGIVVHGLEHYGLTFLGHAIHDAAHVVGGVTSKIAGWVGASVEWVVGAAGAGLVGLAIGAALAPILTRVLPSH